MHQLFISIGLRIGVHNIVSSNLAELLKLLAYTQSDNLLSCRSYRLVKNCSDILTILRNLLELLLFT